MTGFLTIANMALPATAPEPFAGRLSVLQRRLLLLASINRIQASIEEQGSAETPTVDLYYSQVLEEVYGFPPAVGGEHSPGGKRFDRQAIGAARYNAAAAALSRSMRRLHNCGLILCLHGSNNRWSGCSITPKGQRLIHEMLNARNG